MAMKTMLKTFVVLVLCGESMEDPGPQYYPLSFSVQSQRAPQTPHAPQASRHQGPSFPQHHNLSAHGPSLDPASFPAAEEILKNDIPRQLYGVPPPSYPSPGGYPSSTGGFPSPSPSGFPSTPSGFPQIYKLDNLIIIANPPPQQACPPQRPPPDFPRPRPGSGTDGPTDGLEDRFGGEPSKCTWAIVACCSPGNNNVRYNCFELLGCPGFFFDTSPCDPQIVMQASQLALDYYSSRANTTNSGVDTNSV